MKYFWVALFGSVFVTFVVSDLLPCDPDDDKSIPECVETNYEAYEKCLREQQKRRLKRNTTPCAVAACQQQYDACFTNCGGQPACQVQCPTCQQQIYYQQPEIAQQQQMYYQAVPQTGFRTILIGGQDGQPPSEHKMELTGGHNITTVINLKNIVNNTNVVNVPTNINSTNVNNIHVYSNHTIPGVTPGGRFGLGYTKRGSCCLAVQPKTCRTSSSGPRCHHRRHKTCGQQCKSRVIHVQPKKVCNRQQGCQRTISYIPQPQPPQCVYTQQWPHVSCGGQYQSSCDGCYEYGGYEQRGCSGCYNEGFDIGPLYRRGPVLRPSYRHEPPCPFRGGCDSNYDDYGYEDYGTINRRTFQHPRGSYNPRVRPNYNPVPDYEYGDTEYDDSIDQYDTDGNDIDIPMNINDTDIDSIEWGVATHKCKVVEDDGTIQIKNCTGTEYNNPYAGSVSSPIYRPRVHRAIHPRLYSQPLPYQHTSHLTVEKFKFPEDDD